MLGLKIKGLPTQGDVTSTNKTRIRRVISLNNRISF